MLGEGAPVEERESGGTGEEVAVGGREGRADSHWEKRYCVTEVRQSTIVPKTSVRRALGGL